MRNVRTLALVGAWLAIAAPGAAQDILDGVTMPASPGAAPALAPAPAPPPTARPAAAPRRTEAPAVPVALPQQEADILDGKWMPAPGAAGAARAAAVLALPAARSTVLPALRSAARPPTLAAARAPAPAAPRSPPAPAQPGTHIITFGPVVSSSDPISQLLEMAGTWQTAQGLPAAMLAQCDSEFAGAPHFHAVFRGAIEKYAHPRDIYQAVYAEVKRAGNGPAFADAIAAQRSPIALKFNALEAETGHLAALDEVQKLALAQELAQAAPDPARLGFFDRIDRCMGVTEVASDIAVESYVASALAVRSALAGGKNRGPDDGQELAESAEHFRTQVSAEIKQRNVSGMTLTYRKATLAELRQYTELIECPRLRWYLTAVKAGYGRSMKKIFSDIGTTIGQSLSPPMILELLQSLPAGAAHE